MNPPHSYQKLDLLLHFILPFYIFTRVSSSMMHEFTRSRGSLIPSGKVGTLKISLHQQQPHTIDVDDLGQARFWTLRPCQQSIQHDNDMNITRHVRIGIRDNYPTRIKKDIENITRGNFLLIFGVSQHHSTPTVHLVGPHNTIVECSKS